MNLKITRAITPAFAVAILLSACANNGSKPQFGDTVRYMTHEQIYNLDAAYNPDPAPVLGGDVYKMKDVLEAHENNAEDPTEDTGALVTGEY